MCQLIFLIYYLFRRPKIARLTADSFPNVPPDEFLEWKRLELQSIDIFLWGSAILCGLSFFAGAIVGSMHPSSPSDAQSMVVVAQVGLFVAMLVVLVIAVIPGQKAVKIRKRYGFTV